MRSATLLSPSPNKLPKEHQPSSLHSRGAALNHPLTAITAMNQPPPQQPTAAIGSATAAVRPATNAMLTPQQQQQQQHLLWQQQQSQQLQQPQRMQQLAAVTAAASAAANQPSSHAATSAAASQWATGSATGGSDIFSPWGSSTGPVVFQPQFPRPAYGTNAAPTIATATPNHYPTAFAGSATATATATGQVQYPQQQQTQYPTAHSTPTRNPAALYASAQPQHLQSATTSTTPQRSPYGAAFPHPHQQQQQPVQPQQPQQHQQSMSLSATPTSAVPTAALMNPAGYTYAAHHYAQHKTDTPQQTTAASKPPTTPQKQQYSSSSSSSAATGSAKRSTPSHTPAYRSKLKRTKDDIRGNIARILLHNAADATATSASAAADDSDSTAAAADDDESTAMSDRRSAKRWRTESRRGYSTMDETADGSGSGSGSGSSTGSSSAASASTTTAAAAPDADADADAEEDDDGRTDAFAKAAKKVPLEQVINEVVAEQRLIKARRRQPTDTFTLREVTQMMTACMDELRLRLSDEMNELLAEQFDSFTNYNKDYVQRGLKQSQHDYYT